jgi:hypothetical protein
MPFVPTAPAKNMTGDFSDPQPPGTPEALLLADFERQTEHLTMQSLPDIEAARERMTPGEQMQFAFILHAADNSIAPRILRGDYPTLQRSAAQLVNRLGDPAEMTIATAFATHMQMSYGALGVRELPSYRPETDNSITYFLTQFAELLAWQLPAETIDNGPDPNTFLTAIEPRLHAIAESIDLSFAWVRAKAMTLATAIIRRRHAEVYIEQEPHLIVDDETMEAMTGTNNELMAELMRLGRHTITDSVIPTDTASWSLHDMLGLKLQYVNLTMAEGSNVHPDQWIPMHMIAIERPAHVLGIGIPITDSTPVNLAGITSFCYMDARGELYVDMCGTIPLSLVYERYGKAANYQLLRQFLIGSYCGLSVPEAVGAEVEQKPKSERNAYRIALLRRFPDADSLDAAT